MPDETTSRLAPVDTAIPQAPETLNSTPPEVVIASASVEAPVAPVPVLETIPEHASAHLGGNDPIELVPAESIPPTPTIETTAEAPVAITEPVPDETPTPEPPEETTQQTPAKPVIEATPVAESADSLLGRRVETSAPAQIPEPVVAQVPVSASTPTPIATTPTPAQAVATAVTPIVATTIAQTFTKSMRELFTKALNARQNKKRKKLDRILSLFAKQTMITNNEVEKLLHISDSTATRYLATLEKEGKLKQNAKKGHATSYSKI